MKNILFVLLLCVVLGCNKDYQIEDPVLLDNETISGSVSYLDDIPCCKDITVSIVRKDIAVDSTILEVLGTVEVDEDGDYLFDNILPGQENLYLTINESVHIHSAMDETPDGDEDENDLQPIIGIFLEEDENDDGNNFVIENMYCDSSFIQGYVYSIADQDTTDTPSAVLVNLYSTDTNGNLIELVGSVNTFGAFTFSTLPLFNGVLEIEHGINSSFQIISGIDESPDDDPISGQLVSHLPVELDSCEVDSDNNFYLVFEESKLSISGKILLDLDNDGIGDEGIVDQRIELYERGIDNLPVSPFIGFLNSDQDGNFAFYNIPVGEYVLYFKGSGTGEYEVVEGYDLDQELAEPDYINDPQLIAVNISDIDFPDENNIFLMEEIIGCNAIPEIFPYPALCDTSIICTYDRLPVYLLDEEGEAITTVGGIYLLEWTDLVTGVTNIGDWAYHVTNHPIQVKVTYPDGCVYIIDYHRDCEQDLFGSFSLRTMTTGLGNSVDYEPEEIKWTFNPFEKTVIIEHDIINTLNNPNLLEEGEYVYLLQETSDGLELTITSSDTGIEHHIGLVVFQGGQVILGYDNIPLDGIGRYMEKN